MEQLQAGEIYALCKDQHGCRYLQKKLEDNNPHYVQLIFMETNQHVVELMTGESLMSDIYCAQLISPDPFGNYLCQKLFEKCNPQQLTVLINNTADSMTKIALNQHGTRALQKLIASITTQDQVHQAFHCPTIEPADKCIDRDSHSCAVRQGRTPDPRSEWQPCDSEMLEQIDL